MAKLKKLLEDIFQEQPQINKYEVIEGVRSFGIVGKALYNNSNIMEIAKQLSHIAEQAHTHIIGETDDWFDKVSVNKNMQSLKRSKWRWSCRICRWKRYGYRCIICWPISSRFWSW